MEKLSYLATMTDKNSIEVSLCDTVPDFVHMIKYDNTNNVEIYFSADVDWTPVQENMVMEQVLNNLCVASEIF